jgi:hypothetical protein
MIGLMFLGATVLWLIAVYQITLRVPKWLNLKKHAWTVQALVALLLLVGPFVDHIIGMRQFEKLCAEEGRLNISPAAVNTKRAKKLIEDYVPLKGYVVRIEQMVIRVVDLDTGEQIAQYKYFSTPGGVVGKLPQLGGRFTCSARDREHVDRKKLDALAVQTNLVF